MKKNSIIVGYLAVVLSLVVSCKDIQIAETSQTLATTNNSYVESESSTVECEYSQDLSHLEDAPTIDEYSWPDLQERMDMIPSVQIVRSEQRVSLFVDDSYEVLGEELDSVNEILNSADCVFSDVDITRCDNKVISFNYRVDDMNVYYSRCYDVNGFRLCLNDVVTSRQDVVNRVSDYIDENYNSSIHNISIEQIEDHIMHITEDKWYLDVCSIVFIVDYSYIDNEGVLIYNSIPIHIPYTEINEIMNPNYVVDVCAPIVGEYSQGSFMVDDSTIISTVSQNMNMRQSDIVDIRINGMGAGIYDNGWSCNGICRFIRDYEGDNYLIVYRYEDYEESAESMFMISIYCIDCGELTEEVSINTNIEPSYINSIDELSSYIG